jgi:hypothetical protein
VNTVKTPSDRRCSLVKDFREREIKYATNAIENPAALIHPSLPPIYARYLELAQNIINLRASHDVKL